MNNKRNLYCGDTRYAKVWEQMQLLNIQDVSTERQIKNGTITWRLPIKRGYGTSTTGNFIEVGSFKTGYVRNNNCASSNYQLNKQVNGKPEYVKLSNGDYRKYTGKERVLIPIEIDRLEYLISYCLKNYYIKNANQVADGKYVNQWYHKYELEQQKEKYNNLADAARIDYENKNDEVAAFRNEAESLNDCGHYERIINLELQNEILQNKLQSVIRTARH